MIKTKLFSGLAMSLLILSQFTSVTALDNGLCKTPPMGWNSWNCFGPNIDETKIKGVADAMVSSGLRDAGYIYLNLDDNWMAKSRDANGNLQGDPTRFPKGMKELGDYIHSKGLKFGIYGDRGTVTCYFRDNFKELKTQSGSAGKEIQDAKTFASWGVDYLKYDNCEVGYAAPAATMQKDYTTMRDALAKSGRDIVFSICAWEFKDWMPEVGNLWRTTTDILNHWKKEGSDWSWGILDIVDLNEKYAQYAKPGAWNDPDMLQVGNFGGNRAPTEAEYRSHMSLWCIMAAPIIMGNDIRSMNQATKNILLNKEVIAVDQDSAGIQGRKIKSTNGLDVWCKPLGTKDGNVKAVALFNRNSTTATITVNFSDIGLTGTATVRDLWAKTDKGNFTGSYSMSVPSHDCAMLKIATGTAAKEMRRTASGKPYCTAGFAKGKLTVTPSVDNQRYGVTIYAMDGKLVKKANNLTSASAFPVSSGLYYVETRINDIQEKSIVTTY